MSSIGTAIINQVVGYGMLATVIVAIVMIVYLYVVPAIMEWWNNFIKSLEDWFTGMIPKPPSLGGAWDKGKEIVEDVIDEVKPIVEDVIDEVKPIVEDVIDTVKDGANNIDKTVTDIVQDPLNVLANANGVIDNKYIPELAYCPAGSTDNRSEANKLARAARITAMVLPATSVPLLAPLIAVYLNSKVEQCHTCPSGYGYDPLTMKCIKYCPSGTKDTGQFCSRDRKYSTVGTSGAMKLVCPKGTTEYAGLCYELPSGWEVMMAGRIGQKCSTVLADSKEVLGKCRVESASYTRDFSSLNKCKEYVKNDGLCKGTGKWGARAYIDDCAGLARDKGHYASASQFKKSGIKCTRPAVTKDRPQRAQTGKVKVLECPTDKEKHGLLCYPKCPSGYYRSSADLEYCSALCPSGFTDIGIGGCKKPSVNDSKQPLSQVGVCSDTTRPNKHGALCLNDIQVANVKQFLTDNISKISNK